MIMTQLELFAAIIAARGYLVIGMPRPMRIGERLTRVMLVHHWWDLELFTFPQPLAVIAPTTREDKQAQDALGISMGASGIDEVPGYEFFYRFHTD